MNIRYFSLAAIAIILLPVMYLQGRLIRASVPRLPEAKGKQGRCQSTENKGSTLKVISIGESTIAGVGVHTHDEGFTGTFAKEISRLFEVNVDWKVYARSGYTIRKVERRIVPEIVDNEADLIVVGLGGNDAFSLKRPSKWRAEAHSFIKSIKAKFPAAIIVFCNMPPIKEFPAFTPLIKFTVGNLVEILGEELNDVVKEHQGVFYFEDKITLAGWIDKLQMNVSKNDFFSDGVHPSKLTYQVWARDVADKVFQNEDIKVVLDKAVG